MKTGYIDIPEKKWGIVVVYDFDTDYDYLDMLAIMRSFNMSKRNSEKAISILSNYNTGMAVSIDSLKMSAIFVSKATSPNEFWSTVNHELHHVNVAIIDYYGEPYDDEGAAYLQGYMMHQAVKVLGEPCNSY